MNFILQHFEFFIFKYFRFHFIQLNHWNFCSNIHNNFENVSSMFLWIDRLIFMPKINLGQLVIFVFIKKFFIKKFHLKASL
jgi:hypothetical protein